MSTGTHDVRVTRVLYSGGTETALECDDAGTDFTVNLASYSGWDSGGTGQDWVIHIYSCSGASIGHVTISGYPLVGETTPAISSLAVLVGGASQAWNENADDPLFSGCADFGGLDISDSDMRAKTRASIAVSNNITAVTSPSPPAPDIHVNQIIRVQAHGHDAGDPILRVGGTIDGNITADGSGTLFGSNPAAIGQVRAWNTINGDIVASEKDISAVRVIGLASNSPGGVVGGIQGDISAAEGTIGQVWTSGPIGGSTNPVTITAGTRVGLITCRNDATATSDTEVLDEPIYANIEASALGTADTSVNSSVSLIETAGDFVGGVCACNFGGPSGRGC